jgi:PIN domain
VSGYLIDTTPLSALVFNRPAAVALINPWFRPPYGPGLIGDIDTLIAATALEYDLTLVTTDSDFVRVPGLNLILLDRITLTPRST